MIRVLTFLAGLAMGWPTRRLMIIDCDDCGRVRVCCRRGVKGRMVCGECVNGRQRGATAETEPSIGQS